MVRFADALRCDARPDAIPHSAEQSRAAGGAMNGAPYRAGRKTVPGVAGVLFDVCRQASYRARAAAPV
jgi:hypothetical protein